MNEDDPEKRQRRAFKPNADFSAKRPGARSFILSPDGAFIHQDGKLETVADAVDFFWSVIARTPSGWSNATKGYNYLLDRALEADREDVRRTLGWIEAALAQRDRDAATAACKYLCAMPSPLLAGDYGRLLAVFNSRIVGMVWQVTPSLDVRHLPPRIPKFGQEAGFGMIRAVPELYEKLAMFGPEMEDVVIGLVEEAIRYDVSLPPSLINLVRSSPSATG